MRRCLCFLKYYDYYFVLIDNIRHPRRPSLSYTNERRGKQRSPEDSVSYVPFAKSFYLST